jgi:hypothetical protein
MVFLILGVPMLILATVLDFNFRRRMQRAGHKWVFLRRGWFNYDRYHNLRKARGWPAWPVDVMWLSYVLGIAFLVVGFFNCLGSKAPRRRVFENPPVRLH